MADQVITRCTLEEAITGLGAILAAAAAVESYRNDAALESFRIKLRDACAEYNLDHPGALDRVQETQALLGSLMERTSVEAHCGECGCVWDIEEAEAAENAEVQCPHCGEWVVVQ